MPETTRLVVGCNYHTTWQSHPAMRFVLAEIKGHRAKLETRNSNKSFWTNVSDLIFIESDYNKRKADSLLEHGINIPDWVNKLPDHS